MPVLHMPEVQKWIAAITHVLGDKSVIHPNKLPGDIKNHHLRMCRFGLRLRQLQNIKGLKTETTFASSTTG